MALSGAHRLTRSLLGSLRRCCIAPVFPALVLDNYQNHYLDSHLDHKQRCCSPVRVALSVDSDLHLGTGVRERSRLIPRLRCTPRVISHFCWLFKGFSAVLDCHHSTLAIKGRCSFPPPWPVNCWTITAQESIWLQRSTLLSMLSFRRQILIKWTMFTERETERLRFLSTHQTRASWYRNVQGNVLGERDGETAKASWSWKQRPHWALLTSQAQVVLKTTTFVL